MRTVSALAVCLALAGCAQVASTVGFPAADANDDEMLSRAEFQEFWDDTDAFERFDDNDDGHLTRTEYNEAVDTEYETDAHFRHVDGNNDSRVTRDEMIDGWFTMFDTDRNGSLSDNEFERAIESLEVEF